MIQKTLFEQETDEIWKDVVGYEGLYKVSNKGRVKGIYNKILKYSKHNKGYNQVTLCINNNIKTLYVHRVVAKAFIHNPMNKPVINHINGNKTDNRAENLEWCTQRENMIHENVKRKNKLIGVRPIYYKNTTSYFSQITINSKTYYCGTYKTPEAAREAYLNRLNEYNLTGK